MKALIKAAQKQDPQSCKYDCIECYKMVYALLNEYGAFRVLDAIEGWTNEQSYSLAMRNRTGILAGQLKAHMDAVTFEKYERER